MAVLYEQTGLHSGVVTEHARWTLNESQHPRLLQVPILPVIDNFVVLLVDEQRRTPRLPRIYFTSASFPPVPEPPENPLPLDKTGRLQYQVIRHVRTNLLDSGTAPVTPRFMGAHKAYSDDLSLQNGSRLAPRLATVERMIDIKQLPFIAYIDAQPDEIRLNSEYRRRELLGMQPKILPYHVALAGLENIVSHMRNHGRHGNAIIDILQLLELYGTMTPYRKDECAAHTR